MILDFSRPSNFDLFQAALEDAGWTWATTAATPPPPPPPPPPPTPRPARPPQVTTRTFSWLDLTQRSWGPDWTGPTVIYRFSNGREFIAPTPEWPATLTLFYRITEDDQPRITEAGDPRII